MADLVLKLDELVQLRDDLDAVVREFQNADDFSDSVAEATGHDDLHGHVRDFAHKWNEKRSDMTENVKIVQLPYIPYRAPVHLMLNAASTTQAQLTRINQAITQLEQNGALPAIRARYGIN